MALSHVPMVARHFALVPALLLALAASGCDEEPDCSVTATLQGAYEGMLDLSVVGRDSCGFADTRMVDPESTALAFSDRGSESPQSMYVFSQTPVLSLGSHPGRVTLVLVGDVWEPAAATCTIDITEFTYEDWSRTDFFRVGGTVACPDPLVAMTPGLPDITLSDVAFEGHLHAEVLEFDFL